MKKAINNIVLCSLFTALILVFTAFLHIPVGIGQYIHIGDAFIYLSACVLPFPLGPLAGLLGGGISDIISGYAYWAPFTMLIKFLTALPYSYRDTNIFSKKNAAKSALSGLISLAGYYLSTVAIFAFGLGSYTKESSSFTKLLGLAAVDSIPGSVIQGAASIILFLIFAKALDKMNFKKKLKVTT